MGSNVLIIGGVGYIGSSLARHLHSVGHSVSTVDLELFPLAEDSKLLQPSPNIKMNFRDLSADYLATIDVVVHLAGHSSVPACELDPDGSMTNNCLNFFHLVGRLPKTTKFIYASSGSVYGSSGRHASKETEKLSTPIMHYDRQKQLVDEFMVFSGKNYFGLRLGTVCGFSPNPRNELMINSMTRSAIEDHLITATNNSSFRAILGMSDLCKSVDALIQSDAEKGFYNIASFNMTIGAIARELSDHHNCSLTSLSKGSSQYSFCLDTSKFTSATGYQFLDTPALISASAALNDFSKVRKWDIRI